MQMAKEIGTWNMMQRKNDECCFCLEEQAAAEGTEQAAAEGTDKVKQVKAKPNKTRAIQKTINYTCNTLHSQDKARVTTEMKKDDLVGLWEALQIKPTIEVLDQLVEMMFKLDCGTKDVLEFVCEWTLCPRLLEFLELGNRCW